MLTTTSYLDIITLIRILTTTSYLDIITLIRLLTTTVFLLNAMFICSQT